MKRYLDMIDDLLSKDAVRNMANFNQHSNVDTLLHSMHVSYTVYQICHCLKIKPDDIVRAAFLHDFCLYDWHKEKFMLKHAFNHPKAAIRNIEKYHLPINEYQKRMILCHMFPLAPIPNSVGGWILTFADKYCTCKEIFGFAGNIYSKFTKILKGYKIEEIGGDYENSI